MGTPLASYPSRSKPGKEYTVWEPNGGGDPYCDCWQWKRNRTCKHLEMYHNKAGGTTKIIKVTRLSPAEKVEDDFDRDIANAVSNIINRSG